MQRLRPLAPPLRAGLRDPLRGELRAAPAHAPAAAARLSQSSRAHASAAASARCGAGALLHRRLGADPRSRRWTRSCRFWPSSCRSNGRARLFIALTFLLLAGGTAAIHRALFGRWSPWSLLAFLLLYTRLLLWGFMGYLFGCGLALAAFAAWIALARRHWLLRLVLGMRVRARGLFRASARFRHVCGDGRDLRVRRRSGCGASRSARRSAISSSAACRSCRRSR